MRVTQQQVEARSGLTQSGLSKVETGDGNIAMRTLLQIACGLQVKPSFLVSLLDGSLPARAATSTTIAGVAVATDSGATADDVKNLTRELSSRTARAGKARSKARRR